MHLVGVAAAGVIDRISQDKTIRIAYREDAPPFSYKDKIGEPAGFMVDLCRGAKARGINVVNASPGHRGRSLRGHPQQRADFYASRRAPLCLDASWSIFRSQLLSTAPA